jgi:beta-lactamase class A
MISSSKVENIIQNTVQNIGGEWGIVFKFLPNGTEVKLNSMDCFASASLIKLPILICAMSAAEEKKIDLNERIELDYSNISEEDKEGSGVIILLRNPVSLTYIDLCTLMIIVSDNFATNVIIDLLGMDYINQKFVEFGLTATRLNHKINNFKELMNRETNPTTPQDISHLLEQIYCRNLPSSELMEFILKKQIYGTRLPYLLPYEKDSLSICHKTGSLNTIAHDAGFFRIFEGDYILSVLTQKQKEVAKTNLAIAELSKNIYELITKH